MPRPLNEQTIVLTGASSEIGREAAALLAERGAAVVLAARDEAALHGWTDAETDVLLEGKSLVGNKGKGAKEPKKEQEPK
jgi:short-subunit dehydrogenase